MVKMFFKGWRMPVTIGPTLLQTGWYGGQWVRFTGNLTVEKASVSSVAGILLTGYKLEDCDGKPYDYNNMDGLQIFKPYQYENQAINAFGKATMATDDGLYDFNSNVYETLVYSYNQILYLNSEGLLTNVDSGFPYIGIVAGLPSDNNGWLRVLVRM
ncbi:MAG: hypothetical protein PHF86_07450 [Candidatus Nanoarchaeia archaeon]|jgi:hypothetical protein|nr:hypothetical protein [Candidatus Nanoarchaeia archaeon]